MQLPNNRNNGAVSDLFMAELAEGKGRFIGKLIDGVMFACEKTSWVLSAHLPSQPGGRAFPNYKNNYIDLGSGAMGETLSWIYYYLTDEFNKVNPLISERLRHELQVKILDAYTENTYFWWLASNYKEGMMINNWNPWCNEMSIVCFFLLENDRDKLANAVYKSMISVDKFINYTKEDGACEEGPSYWGHAAGKMYDYLQMIYDGTNGKISIFNEPMIKSMGEYIANSYVGDGWVVNFADASARGGGESSMIWQYGKAIGSEHMMSYAGYLNSLNKPGSPSGSDYFRRFKALQTDKEFRAQSADFKPQPCSWYPQTEFCYMSDKNGSFFAAKGGYNNESHNHNDAGTFNFYIDKTPIIIDAGVGTYTRQTFGSGRYNIWTMKSDYHNLPVINGQIQSYGSKFKANDTKFDQKKMRFSTNIAAAYPESTGIKSWQRSYVLAKGALKIEDNFNITNPTVPNIINFMTWGDIDISTPGIITIAIKGKKAELKYDKALFTPTIETIKLEDKRLSSVWGDQIYRVSLTANESKETGKYLFTINRI
ncbi:MAG: heparinase II/III family protein [Rikenellaceae bacterium]